VALTRVELEQFTAFASLELDLCRGINVLVGANGTGKTHLMKVCYVACDVSRSPADDFAQKLVGVFMPSGRSLRRLVRQQGGADGEAAIRVWRGALKLESSFSSRPGPVPGTVSAFFTDDDPDQMKAWAREPVECVYVPVKEMLSSGPGFRSLYARREVHFEAVYNDILDRAYLPASRGPVDSAREELAARLQTAIGGEVAVENEEFFLRGEQENIEFSLLSEGVRKLALLWLLIRNDVISPGSVLFWDEPETNLNPKLFGVLMDVFLELQRNGVQIFLATHDYVVLKELDLRAREADQVAFHALYREDETGEIACATSNSYRDVHPNAIADTFTDLYDREIARSLRTAK
jgi:ABC-type transport system involved in cytochrome c biogenesis ATPase subunit